MTNREKLIEFYKERIEIIREKRPNDYVSTFCPCNCINPFYCYEDTCPFHDEGKGSCLEALLGDEYEIQETK